VKGAVAALALALAACGAGTPAPAREATTSSAPAAHTLRVLYDDFGREAPGLEKDWGYAALVAFEGKQILFDSGRNADILGKNAAALGVDFAKIDLVVISHAHVDHTSGLDAVLKANPKVPLYLPDDGDLGAPFFTHAPAAGADEVPRELRYADPPRPSSGRWWGANVRFMKKSEEIAPGVTLVVTESPNTGFFTRYPPNDTQPKLVGLPEVSMSLKTPKGEVLVVGCSHTGIEAIVKETSRVTGRKVDMVAGGMHLFPYPKEEASRVARALKSDLGVSRIAPGHCSGHYGFKAFKEAYGDACAYAGLGADVVY
jgi:7,8-dihydropterin-6-yl-methyl-4-(beta-D-ribofuranosyl)aminobenzene 5'-phosphate synthase